MQKESPDNGRTLVVFHFLGTLSGALETSRQELLKMGPFEKTSPSKRDPLFQLPVSPYPLNLGGDISPPAALPKAL